MNFQFKIGLKLYSTNTDLIPEALPLKNNFFNFIELYIVPGSYDETISAWKEFDVPYVIHAPHFFHGVNLAQIEKWETNLVSYNETRLFADDLNSDIIIAHGGNKGSFDETIRQIRSIGDKRIVLENKPKLGLNNEICVGWSPSEFRKIFDENIINGIALDFVHASCAARSSNIDVMDIVKELMYFNPKIFHLSDGDSLSEQDKHFNLGKGNLNLLHFIQVIPVNGLLTIETPRESSKKLTDFIDDVKYLKKLLATKDK
ncbi:MAG: sugar phosphate isomerase/epimerase [Desulfobacterales bacterium]|nr:sugar phosphate isomerase/epimerase [Desulfobacterales bacterium]